MRIGEGGDDGDKDNREDVGAVHGGWRFEKVYGRKNVSEVTSTPCSYPWIYHDGVETQKDGRDACRPENRTAALRILVAGNWDMIFHHFPLFSGLVSRVRASQTPKNTADSTEDVGRFAASHFRTRSPMCFQSSNVFAHHVVGEVGRGDLSKKCSPNMRHTAVFTERRAAFGELKHTENSRIFLLVHEENGRGHHRT